MPARSAHQPFVGDAAFEVEKAIESIQLLGTPKQIELAQQLVKEFAEHQGTNWQLLLVELRASLREDLGLETAEESLVHLRVLDGAEGIVPSPPTGKSSRGIVVNRTMKMDERLRAPRLPAKR